MNVLIVTAVFPPEPVVSAKLSFDIACTISQTADIVVLSPKPTRPFGFKFDDSSVKLNFKHIRTNSYTCPKYNMLGRLRETYSFGRHCYKYISKHHSEINLIYSNTWPLLAQFYTVKAARRFNIPIVVHVQDIYPESLSSKLPLGAPLIKLFLMPIDKYVLRNADGIIAISDKMDNYLVETRGINSKKVFVVQNWQDEESFIEYNSQEISGKNENLPFTFMYLGNIGPVAGVDLLIDAFVRAKLQNCRLVIAGSGSVRELLESKTRELKGVKIEFWSVANGKVPEIQSFADVMLLPMKKGAASSSIPSKLAAYMFSKKPIIASVDEESDTANAIKQSNCGWILPPENIDLLTKAMQTIVSIPKEDLQNKGRNGLNYAMKYLSKKNNIIKLLKVMNAIARG